MPMVLFWVLPVFVSLFPPSALDAAEFRVFDVSVSLAGEGDDAQRGPDYYLSGGSQDGLRAGQRLEIYRDRTVVDPITEERHPVRLPVGEIELISVHPTASVGRRVKLVSRDRAPLLRHHAVMIGDVARVVDRPVARKANTEPLMPKTPTPVSAALSFELPSHVLFDLDSAVIKAPPAEFAGLEDALERFPTHHLIVEGHTCDLGPRAHNEKLALARARSVADYLTQRHDVPETRMTVAGYGPSRPVDPGKKGRAKNRRVEIRFVTPAAGPTEG